MPAYQIDRKYEATWLAYSAQFRKPTPHFADVFDRLS